ncbi:unnamed protein product [Echinostoma caproni]|uniref:PDZ domain-containing protein n=1 Tax=Echinostoma caproni TaxID=27848 RepID=A0A183AMU4_9TREM|nr:unnamed protein product [Echinostoma caproni]
MPGVTSSRSVTTPRTPPPVPASVRTPEALSESEDNRASPVWFEVELRKPSSSSGLGFSIAGGRDEDDQMNMSGIFITRVNPDGLAYQDGRILPGDQLMQVNGIDVSQLSHAEAVQVLRNAGEVVHLLLARYPQSAGSESGRSLESRSSKGKR